MSQFDKDDVEDLGLLKLDILGIRMQSSLDLMATSVPPQASPEFALKNGRRCSRSAGSQTYTKVPRMPRVSRTA